MEKEKYKEKASNPDAWFKIAKEQRFIGDLLWEEFAQSTYKAAKKKKETEGSALNLEEAFVLLSNSQFHYGLAIENALKGSIIKNKPEDVSIIEENDDIRIQKIGVNMNKGHQLRLLAEILGIFRGNVIPNYSSDTYNDYLKKVLDHLSDIVIWGARYPVPLALKKRLMYPAGTPQIIYGHYIRDISDPLLDHLLRP